MEAVRKASPGSAPSAHRARNVQRTAPRQGKSPTSDKAAGDKPRSASQKADSSKRNRAEGSSKTRQANAMMAPSVAMQTGGATSAASLTGAASALGETLSTSWLSDGVGNLIDSPGSQSAESWVGPSGPLKLNRAASDERSSNTGNAPSKQSDAKPENGMNEGAKSRIHVHSKPGVVWSSGNDGQDTFDAIHEIVSNPDFKQRGDFYVHTSYVNVHPLASPQQRDKIIENEFRMATEAFRKAGVQADFARHTQYLSFPWKKAMFIAVTTLANNSEDAETQFNPTRLNGATTRFTEKDTAPFRRQLKNKKFEDPVHIVHSIQASNEHSFKEKVNLARSLLSLSGMALSQLRRNDIEYIGRGRYLIHFRGVRVPSELYGEPDPKQEVSRPREE